MISKKIILSKCTNTKFLVTFIHRKYDNEKRQLIFTAIHNREDNHT